LGVERKQDFGLILGWGCGGLPVGRHPVYFGENTFEGVVVVLAATYAGDDLINQLERVALIQLTHGFNHIKKYSFWQVFFIDILGVNVCLRVCPDSKFMLLGLIQGLAVGLNILFVWPQVLRIVRLRVVDGVSWVTWVISCVLFSVWAGYAWGEQYWSLLVANVSCFVGALLLLFVGAKLRWGFRVLGLAVGAVVMVGLVSAVWGVVAVAIMTVAGVGMRVPQVVALLRSEGVAGVSVSTWAMSTVTAALWLSISLSKGATGAAIANVTALVAGLVLLGLLFWKRNRVDFYRSDDDELV
jgi:uncharacterized protein with PQ loop repeat